MNRLTRGLALVVLTLSISLVSCKGDDDCCVKTSLKKKSTSLNDEKSLINYKGRRPFCKINRYLCKNLAVNDADANTELLIKTLDKLEKSSPKIAVGKNPQLHDILEALTRSSRLRRQGRMCSVQSLMANLKDLPKLRLMFSGDKAGAGNVTLSRIDSIVSEAKLDYNSKCSGGNILERYHEHMRTLNRRQQEIILRCLDPVVRKQLFVTTNGAPFTRQHFRMSSYMVNLRDQAAAKLLVDGLGSVGDGATVGYLKPEGRDQRGVSTRRINYILKRYVVSSCSYFVNHFKDLYPNLARGDFDKFSVYLEPHQPNGANTSDYFHYWILYDACRLFTNELLHYPDPISKRIVQEVNGYRLQEPPSDSDGYKTELETAI